MTDAEKAQREAMTTAELRALNKLGVQTEDRSAYGLEENAATLQLLFERGLADRFNQDGYMEAPQTCILWSITLAGRDRLRGA